MTDRETSIYHLALYGVRPGDTSAIVRAAKTLHTLYEHSCNGYQDHKGNWDENATNRAEKKTDTLQAKIDTMLAAYNLKAYHQTDPRGWPVTVYRPEDLNGRDIGSCYSSIGRAII
jgi:hypothetical protein